MIGILFSMAISWARRFFLAVIGNQAPALTVASLATITQSFPLIFPIFTTTPPEGHPPCTSYMFSPARAPISKASFGSSRRWSILFSKFRTKITRITAIQRGTCVKFSAKPKINKSKPRK